VGPCVNGAPVFLSLPHFQGAPPEYAKSVAGLDKEGKYESVVDIQPVRVITFHPICWAHDVNTHVVLRIKNWRRTLGLPLRASLKIQLNIELEKYATSTLLGPHPMSCFLSCGSKR